MSFALFNILVLFSRTSNSFLGPFLAKRIETRIHDGSGASLFVDMQFVLAAATAISRCRWCGVAITTASTAASSSTRRQRSEEHTSELQSLMRISYAVFCLKKKKTQQQDT